MSLSRFSGVVNPTTISNLNVVPSNQVADAHIEYKNAGAMNEIINDTQSLGFLRAVLPVGIAVLRCKI